jgi:hypothetical protein
MRAAVVPLLLCACVTAPRPLPSASGPLKTTAIALTEVKPAQADFRAQFEADVPAAGMTLGPNGLSVRVEIPQENYIIATVSAPGGDQVFEIGDLACTSTLGNVKERLVSNMRCLARELLARMIESPRIQELARSVHPPAEPLK